MALFMVKKVFEIFAEKFTTVGFIEKDILPRLG